MNKLIPDVVRCKSVDDYIKWCALAAQGVTINKMLVKVPVLNYVLSTSTPTFYRKIKLGIYPQPAEKTAGKGRTDAYWNLEEVLNAEKIYRDSLSLSK